MGREPHNVQVKLEAREEDSELILLRDVDGVLLEIGPTMKEPVEDGTGSLFGGEEATELETLCAALAEAKE